MIDGITRRRFKFSVIDRTLEYNQLLKLPFSQHALQPRLVAKAENPHHRHSSEPVSPQISSVQSHFHKESQGRACPIALRTKIIEHRCVCRLCPPKSSADAHRKEKTRLGFTREGYLSDTPRRGASPSCRFDNPSGRAYPVGCLRQLKPNSIDPQPEGTCRDWERLSSRRSTARRARKRRRQPEFHSPKGT